LQNIGKNVTLNKANCNGDTYMLKQFSVKIEKGEFWYGGANYDAPNMPFSETTEFSNDLLTNNRYNQVSSYLISTKGRCIYSDGFNLDIKNGVMTLYYDGIDPILEKVGTTLKDAYDYITATYFKPDGKVPPKEFFIKPQFNTWMALGRDQTEKGIREYVENLKEGGYPCGVFMIDSEWAKYYGSFTFDKDKYDDPKALIAYLKECGYKVMLWESPFVTPSTQEYRELLAGDMFVKDANGKIAIREWWEGFNPVLDMSNPKTVEWIEKKNQALMELGVDGFKLDAGDIEYYRDDDITYGKVKAREQCKLWSEFGSKYAYNEFRGSFNMGGRALCQRQADKWHNWKLHGINVIVPEIIVQGLMGYYYTCPDMVGGGSIGTDKDFDQEFFVRFCEASALMPMMQFSASPWKRLTKENNDICLKYANLHLSFGEYIYDLAVNASKTGVPIVRHLDYQFPNQGFETELDSFMLGDDYLVAPVVEKGAVTKTLRLPKGKWRYEPDGVIYDGEQEITVSAPLEVLPYFKKIG